MTKKIALSSMVGIGLFSAAIQAKAYGAAHEYVYVFRSGECPAVLPVER